MSARENLPVRFLRMGEGCVVVEFGSVIDPSLNARVHRLARRIVGLQTGGGVEGIRELVPTYRSLAVYFDPLRVSRSSLEEEIAKLLEAAEKDADEKKSDLSPSAGGKTVEVPVLYGGEYGPDLPFVANHAGLPEEEVVRIHASKPYPVYMLGFLPGFPYLGGMDERIAAPRLETPRTRIPAGSVGIAGTQTGFYPLESPGGWRIIGRTPIKAFDPGRDKPFLLEPGDWVRFKPIGREEYERLQKESEGESAGARGITPKANGVPKVGREADAPVFPVAGSAGYGNSVGKDTSGMGARVMDPGLLTTVQDGGRWGYQAYGVSPAGAMDEYAAELANLLVGNSPGAALLEITLKGPTLLFEHGGWVAIGGADCGSTLNGKPVPNWSAFFVEEGSTLSMGFVKDGCRAYLAFAGGIDVPLVMGSRSTFLRAGIGGLGGRPLREGDRLNAFPPAEAHRRVPRGARGGALFLSLPAPFVPLYGPPLLLRVLVGPQEDLFEPEGVDTLFHASYQISHESDRMGYRLEGPKIKHRGKADIVSDALAQGAVQVPGHGMPIVMMADHQTTGGYPKIGTVIRADQYLLAQGKPGDEVRFFACSEEDALAAWRERRSRIAALRTYLEELRRDHAS